MRHRVILPLHPKTLEDLSWHTAQYPQRQILPVITTTHLQQANSISEDEQSDLLHPNIPMASIRRQSDSNQSRAGNDKYRCARALLEPIGYNFAASSISSDTLSYRGQHSCAINWMLIMAFTGIMFGIYDCVEVITQRDAHGNSNNIKCGYFHSCCTCVYKTIKHISNQSALSRVISSHFRPLFYVCCYVGTLATGIGDLIQHKYNDLYKTDKPTAANSCSSCIILFLITATIIIYCLWA